MLPQEQLNEELACYGIEASERQLSLLLQHLNLVIEKNKVLNLTRIDSIEAGITLHIVDSLLLLNAFESTEGPFLDMGTGAGFPGIPLAIMTGRQGILNDSVAKKTAAVAEFIEKLGLAEQLQTSSERVEALGKSRLGAFSCITARAVAALPVLVEYAAPLLRNGGCLVVTKGRLSEEEFRRGVKAAKICGMSLSQRQSYELPSDRGHREILVYEKTGSSRLALPRQIGKAKKEPLA